MRKYDFDYLEDNYINLYEEGIFIRSVEYSSIILSEITGYKLYINCDKKLSKIFLETGFNKNLKDKILNELKSRGYSYRYFDKNNTPIIYDGTQKISKSREKLTQIKQNMIIF